MGTKTNAVKSQFSLKDNSGLKHKAKPTRENVQNKFLTLACQTPVFQTLNIWELAAQKPDSFKKIRGKTK